MPVDLVTLINDTIELLRPILIEKQIEVFLKLNPRSQIIAEVDPDAFKEIILNAIKNSVEAINHTHGRIEISLQDTGAWIILEIKDNGKGISADKMKYVFTPFFTTKSHGTGMGLVNIYKAVKAHKGYVELKSQESSGTTLTVKLPKYQEPKKFIPQE